jgi:hypothetical protein
MVDKAEILKHIFDRNHVRRRGHLPLLNVREVLENEYQRQRHEEYMGKIIAMPEMLLLEGNYIARLRRRTGWNDWRPTSLARYGLRHHVLKVLKRIHRMRTAIVEPHYDTLNIVHFGEGPQA